MYFSYYGLLVILLLYAVYYIYSSSKNEDNGYGNALFILLITFMPVYILVFILFKEVAQGHSTTPSSFGIVIDFQPLIELAKACLAIVISSAILSVLYYRIYRYLKLYVLMLFFNLPLPLGLIILIVK